jgi:hypothetical protein
MNTIKNLYSELDFEYLLDYKVIILVNIDNIGFKIYQVPKIIYSTKQIKEIELVPVTK